MISEPNNTKTTSGNNGNTSHLVFLQPKRLKKKLYNVYCRNIKIYHSCSKPVKKTVLEMFSLKKITSKLYNCLNLFQNHSSLSVVNCQIIIESEINNIIH